MSRIKILYLIDKLEVGGTQRHLAQLVCGLDGGVFEPAVCCLQRLGPIAGEIAAKGVPVGCLGLKRIYGLRARLALRRVAAGIVRDGVDVVHSYLPSANFFGTQAARRAGARAVASVRDIGFKDGLLKRMAARWVNGSADVVTANSQAVARHVLEEGGAAGDKIRVIYNGVADECFRVPDRSAAEALLAGHDTWRGDRLTVGIIANLKPVKNHAGFLAAAGQVLAEMPEAQFLIVGDGPLRKDLEAAAASRGMRDRVTFFGQTAETRTLLAAMDVFTLPSLHEGFPNAVLEAMAAERAVIATANGGCPEIIRHGRNGFLVNPADTQALAEYMIRLLDSRPLRQRMGRAARETVAERFTLERMVGEYEQLYTDMLTPVAPVRSAQTSAMPVMCW